MAKTSSKRFYHHGRTPAAWTGVTVAGVGFVLGAIGAMTGPSWPVIIAATVLVIGSLPLTMAMRALGYGQP